LHLVVRVTPPFRRVCNLAKRLLKWSSPARVYELNNSRNVERCFFLNLILKSLGELKLAYSYLG